MVIPTEVQRSRSAQAALVVGVTVAVIAVLVVAAWLLVGCAGLG
jgi:hypothetical protein